MIFDGSAAQARAVLGAMAAVARQGHHGELPELDLVALRSATTLVFGLPAETPVADLAQPTPEEFADLLGARASEAMVPLVVMSTVDGRVVEPAAALVRDYADASGLAEPAVRDLEELVHGELAPARADMLRRNRESITGEWVDDTSTYGDWLFPYRDVPDEALVARYAALADAEPGSFGRAFHDFYVDNGFGFAGEAASASEEFTTPHDSAHVLSGYDTSVQGELLVSTFTAGMHVEQGLAGHILPVIASWHLGIPLSDLAGSATGALDVPKFWSAWNRGDSTSGDTFDPSWDFWSAVGRSIDEVRTDLGVPPLDPADAADGKYPDWYTPSA